MRVVSFIVSNRNNNGEGILLTWRRKSMHPVAIAVPVVSLIE